MNRTIRIDRLEACYQANVGRKHLCMGSWDSCLIGGYKESLAMAANGFGFGLFSGNDYTQHPTYLLLAEHFGISGAEALDLFRGCNGIYVRAAAEGLARLRAFIDANSPTINSMDFH